MATFTKINSFVQALGEEKHTMATDQLKVVLTNTAIVATNAVYADITSPLATTNLSGATPFNITTTSWTNTSGTSKLILADLTLTATGSFGPFRYVGIFNDTAPSDELIGFYDYGSSITLASTDTFTIDFSGVDGAITLA